MISEREFATEVTGRLQAAGFEAVFAGGCVRDELLGLTPADYDVATSARPEAVRGLFKRTIAVGESFGVVEVLGPRVNGAFLKIQVATFRSDGAYTDGRRPDSVVYSSAEEDARRRDFTVNGMFFDPARGEVIDFVGGRADLESRVLRAIGDPHERIEEDKLRLMRAVRFAARFGLAIDPTTWDAVTHRAGQITVVSPERIADELRKMILHPTRADGMRLLAESGLLPHILPPPAGADEARWRRTLRVFAALESVTVPLGLAVLLADGGPAAAETAVRSLRMSNAEVGRAAWLVGHRGVLTDAASMPPSRLYPLLVDAGAGELIAWHFAEAAADGRDPAGASHCAELLRMKPRDELNPPPLLTGQHLIANGFKPGPQFKLWLDSVRARQLDGELVDSDAALRFIDDLAEGSG